MASIQTVLDFWFGDLQSEASTYANRRKLWFGKAPEFDQQIRDRFAALHQQAIAGELDDWQKTPEGCLALLIVLDQFSRNLWRNSSQAFANDAKALTLAQRAIAQGFDQQIAPIQRIFIYLPLEHSEDQAIQDQSVELFRGLSTDNPELTDCLDYAVKHQTVIKRFGRFPHRNAVLGRETTPEEAEFLQQPGSSF
jgi:uncharacterized protein (DUF924 family)